jgi:hypothetical protein
MTRIIKRLAAILLIVVIATGVFVVFFLENIIIKTLDNKIEATFGSNYQLKYDSEKIRLDGLRVNFSFEKVKFSTDTSHNSLTENYPILFFEATNFSVQGISVIDLLLNKSINVEHLELNQPELLILKRGNTQQEIQQQTDSVQSEIPKILLEYISLNSLSILNGKGAIISYQNKADTLYSAKEISLKIKEIQTDLSSNIIDPNTIKLKDIDLKLDQVFLNPTFSAYKFLVDKGHLRLKKGVLEGFGITAFPKKSFYQTSLESKYRKTLYDIKLDTFLCQSEHLMKMFSDQLFKTSSIELKNIQANFFENNNIAKEENVIKPLLNESILNIPFDMDIDSIMIKNGFIQYQFLAKNSEIPALIEFTELNGLIANIRKSTGKADTVKVFLESKFMHEAPFTFIAEYPLSNINYQWYSGHIRSMPFTSFKPAFRGTKKIDFKKGQINNIFFTGIIEESKTSGQLIFDYEGLKVQIYSKKQKKKWLKSKISNLIIRNNGKQSKEKTNQQVNFNYERPPSVGQFGLYAHGIMDGLAQVILPKSIYTANKK